MRLYLYKWDNSNVENIGDHNLNISCGYVSVVLLN